MNNEHTKVTELSAEQQTGIVEAKQVLASKQDVLMAIGRIQAFNNIKKYVTVTELITFKNIKESKQYKGLVYVDDNEKSVTVTDLKDVCRVFFDRSYESMTQDLNNLEVFGQEFFESAQSMELGYREMRKLRQLPSEEQALIINDESVDLGDKQAVKELIEDFTFKQVTEKAELQKQLDDANQTVQAVRENSDEKQLELDKAKELEAKRRFSQEPWKNTTIDSVAAMMKAKVSIEQGVNQLGDVFLNLCNDESLDEKAIALIARSLLSETLEMHSRINGFANEVFGVLGSKYSPDVSAEDTFIDLQRDDAPVKQGLLD